MQVTGGTAIDVSADVARNGRVVFASGSQRINVFALPIDANTGKVRGAPYRITEGVALGVAPTIHPRLSPDGRKLLFDSNRNGFSELWLRDLPSGKETVAVTGGAAGAGSGYFLKSSGRLSCWKGSARSVIDLSTGESHKIADRVDDVDRKEEWGLLRHDTPNPAWDAIDLRSGQRTPLLQAEHLPLYLAQFSPDDRWIIFLAHNPKTNRIYVARPRGLREIIPQSEWLPITDGKT